MKRFDITYDKPGRIRVRLGSFVFEKNLEIALCERLCRSDAIISAQAHYQNGSVLMYYKEGKREAALNELKSVDIKALTPVEAKGELAVKGADSLFAECVTALLFRKVAYSAFIPTPILSAITIVDSLSFVWKGVKCLLEGKMCVEVLDAASISCCIANKSYSTAANVMLLLRISGLLEDYTRVRTRATLADSLAISGGDVWVLRDGTPTLEKLINVQKGDDVVVHMGTVIPVDGRVVGGEALVNESAMTGEPLSVLKREGASVFAGTAVEEGDIVVRASGNSSDTKINKIIELIDNSENLKSSLQGKAERMADRIVPFSFLGFGAVLLFTRSLVRASAMLMVDYSCALKLSIPIAVISALNEAAKDNITVKGGRFFEELAMADTVVFDKTGTLTSAEPVLAGVIPFGRNSEERILKLAACIEEHFPHSVARAVVNGAKERGINHEEEHTEVNYIVAHGISTTIHGKKAVIGSRHFVEEDEGIVFTPAQEKKIAEGIGECSAVYLAVGGKLAGVLLVNDPPREEAVGVVRKLKEMNLDVVMLTGDSEAAAKSCAEKLGIDMYRAQVLPEDKHKHVEALKAEGRRVVMVGDGINDAPALAAADVSVAMADASDIARECADITLRGSTLSDIIEARQMSEALMRRINKSYKFIVGFNTSLLFLSMLGAISPDSAAFLHNGSTMLACVNSMTNLKG